LDEGAKMGRHWFRESNDEKKKAFFRVRPSTAMASINAEGVERNQEKRGSGRRMGRGAGNCLFRGVWKFKKGQQVETLGCRQKNKKKRPIGNQATLAKRLN